MCSLWQIYMCAYLHHTALEIMSLPVSRVNDLHTKNSPQSVKKNEILAARALFRIYMKMQSFLANQTHVIFSCIKLSLKFGFRSNLEVAHWLPKVREGMLKTKSFYGRL